MKMFNQEKYRSTITLVMIFITSVVNAQVGKNYSPRLTHSEMSKELIDGLESQFEEENKNMPANREIRQINFDRRSLFMEKVLDGAFIKDDALENYVTG